MSFTPSERKTIDTQRTKILHLEWELDACEAAEDTFDTLRVQEELIAAYKIMTELLVDSTPEAKVAKGYRGEMVWYSEIQYTNRNDHTYDQFGVAARIVDSFRTTEDPIRAEVMGQLLQTHFHAQFGISLEFDDFVDIGYIQSFASPLDTVHMLIKNKDPKRSGDVPGLFFRDQN